MIQRIQTVYLFVAALLMSLMIFFPIAKFLIGGEELRLMAFGLQSVDTDTVVVSTIYMGIVIVLAALLPLVTIFCYKSRMTQVRFCLTELVLLVGAQIFAVFYAVRGVRSIETFDLNAISVQLPMLFPFFSMIMIYLAIRGIVRDAKLVKSLDRIR